MSISTSMKRNTAKVPHIMKILGLEELSWGYDLLFLDRGDQMICMKEIICPRICAVWLTPIMVHSNHSTVVDDWECVWLSYGHNVQHPQLL